VSAELLKKIGTGGQSACAILDNDDFVCWGDNTYGQLGIGNTTQQNSPSSPLSFGARHPIDFDLGFGHSCVILDDSTVTCWGLNSSGQLGFEDTTNRGGSGATTPNNNGVVNLGTGRTANLISVSIQNTTCVVLDNYNLKCWGSNTVGKLGQGNSTNLGASASTMGDNLAAIDLGTGKTALDVTGTNNSETCAVTNSNDLKCWGRGTEGGLGSESTAHLGDNPSEMGDFLNEVDLGSGRTVEKLAKDTTCAVLDNKELKCWGKNNFGQLGLGNTMDRGANTGDMGDNLPNVELR